MDHQIIILDGKDVDDPEALAMLQSLYSRSPRSVLEHLEDVKRRGASKFMSTYYVGYGHKSIGDCGFTAIFAEHISLLAAKAIQDNPLYCGQEASTRYLDFSELGLVNPCGIAGATIQANWMSFYERMLPVLIEHFATRFPREEGQKEKVWQKAVKARAFDVARGFLPAGVRTFAAWSTNLRQAADHLKLMRHNPLAEIRDIADGITGRLRDRYPSSFVQREPRNEAERLHRETQERYNAASAARWAFTDDPECPVHGDIWVQDRLDHQAIQSHSDLLSSRPPKTELHQRFRQFGDIVFKMPLDFGGYRDLQRHRSCVQEMPLLTTKHGFHPWYLEQLPETLRADAERVIETATEDLARLDASPADKQYATAIGFTCNVKITCSLPSAVYIAELRSGTTVHPTVRVIAQQMGDLLAEMVPCLALHHDKSAGVWDIRRGEQDIVKREDV